MLRKNRSAQGFGSHHRRHRCKKSPPLSCLRPRGYFEQLEPRHLLSADAVLGAGASTEIIDSFESYGSLVQAHFDDASTDFNTLVPGILLTQRDTTGNGEIDDQDLSAPRMRDLLAIEVLQGSSPNATLAALDTDDDSVVSWNEAYTGIIVDSIHDLLVSFDANNTLDAEDDIDGDTDVDSDDVEKWVFDGLATQYLGSAFPGSGILTTWFDVDLASLSTSGSGEFNLSFQATIDFDDTYQLDLGTAADAEEIELPQWEFDFSGSTPDVDALNRNASITGEVAAPVAVRYAGGEAAFAAAGTVSSSVKAGGDGTASLFWKVVNVGFLGTQAGSGSELALSMAIETAISDPSSPTKLGFADTDGDNDLAEILAFSATSSAGTASTGGSLTATEGPDAAFDLATPIRFDLSYQYQTGNSGPVAVSVAVSAADSVSEVRTALESAINATSLNGLLSVTESGGLLSINLLGGDATPLGFTNGTHFDNGGTLTASGDFDFDTDNDGDEDGDDTEVAFATATFLLAVGGGLSRFVTVAAGTYTRNEWETAVQTALDAAFTPGTVTASLNDADLDDVSLTLSAGASLEIADTDTLSLTMSAGNFIDPTEIAALDAAVPDQRSRLFNSTTATATDAFSITLNLAVRDGLDFTPTGAPQLLIDSTFDTFAGPFDLPDSAPYFVADFNGNERFALPMDNTDFDQYLDFNVFGRAETIAMVQQLEGWLERLEQHVSLAGYDIPLVQSVIGEVLDFSDLLHDTFLSDDLDDDTAGNDVGKLLQEINDLDPDNASIIFFTAQEFGEALDELGILDTTGLPADDFATYDATNRDILYSLDATHEIASVDLPVDFTLDLSPLGSIYSESNISIVAEGGLRAILGLRMGSAGSIDNGTLLTTLNNGTGVDITTGPAITGALSVERVFGRLLADAHFNVTIGATTYAVTVDADNTETNLTTAELIDDIKTALTIASITGGGGTADLNPSLDVVPVGDRIALVGKAAVSGFSLVVSTADTAYTQLGLQSGPASTVSVTSNPVTDPDGGDGGVLTVTTFGSPAVMLTIDNADGNVSVTDLVNDINAKITGTDLEGKIVASRLGDRIVFSAIDKAVYGFSVAADATADNFFSSFSTLNAFLTVIAANEPPFDSLARFGRLSGDATLTINGVGVTVDSDDTDGATAGTVANGSLEDLAVDINAEIAATALGATVVAEVSGTRLMLRANSSTVTSLTVTTAAGNTARTEMGFAASQTAGQLGVTGNRAAPFFFGPTDTTSFRVEITGGTAATGGTPKTATLTYPNDPGSGGPLELLTNATVYDLAADVQRALNTAFGSAAANPLLVGIDAGRLLINIKGGSAGLGATDFNILANSATAAEGRAINELRLYNPTLAVPASINLDANGWDLLITDSNGIVLGVELDGDTTVGNVLTSINTAAAAAGSDVVASIGPLGNGLKLEEAVVGGGRLTVRTVNGSNAAIDLGIYLGGVNTADATGGSTIPDTPGLIIGDTIGTLALIDRVFLRQIDDSTPIVGASFDITTDDPDTGAVEKINLEANFGFVAVTATGEGTLEGDLGVTLVNGDTGRTTLRDLYSAVAEDRNDDGAIDIDDFKQVVNAPSFTLTGELDFDVTVSAGGGIDALISDIDGGTDGIQVGTFSIDVNSPGNPFALPPELPDVDVAWTAGDLGDLEQFANIDFGDVLGALKQLADFLDDYAAFGFLNEEIPLIGISFNDLVALADRFRIAVEEIEQNPAGSVQLLEQKIREEFGLPPGVLTLELADGDDGDSAAGDMLKVKFNLGGGFSESLPIAFGLPDDLIDGAPIDISLEGQADLNATGNLDALFTIGVDLNPGMGLAPVYLYTHESETKLGGSLTASANDLSFNAALGPVGVTIADGGASIELNAEFKSSDAAGTRVPLGSAFAAFDEISFDGEASAVLPVYFPTQSSYIGDISLEAAFEATPGGGLDITQFDVTAPDFELDFESFSLFDNLGLLMDAADLFLRGVQDILSGQVLGFDLPLIGDQLSEAALFIEEFRGGFIKDLRNLVENAPSLAAETVQGFLFDLLGPGGLNLLADTNGIGGITVDDVIIEGLDSLDTPSLSDDYLQWNLLLGQSAPADVNLDFDLGFPALGLNGDFDFNVAVAWEVGIGLGISIADGAYIDVRRQDYTTPADDVLPELAVTFDVTLAETTNISGDLLFLQLDINEAPRDVSGDAVDDPTHFHAEFNVDLTNDGDADAERLPFSEIGNLEFDLDLDADAAVNLDLRLQFNEDLIGSSPLSAILPEVTAHFGLYWEIENALSGELELGDSLKYLAFEDIELDLGSFLGDLIVPVVEKIQAVTEPFQPIVDIVTARIPVLSDLAGETVTLADIAAAFGEFNPDLIYAIADLISLVNSIPTDVESLIIPFGSFVLIDVDGISGNGSDFSFGGITAGNLSDPNFSFQPSGASDPFGGAFTALNGALPSIGDLIGDAEAAGGSTGNAVSGLLGGDFNRTGEDGQEYGFAFPLFEDPSQIFGLLVGRPATIVTYDLPPFVMDFSWKQSFPIYGPLWGVVTASVGMKIDLAFGYDTQGLSDFADGGFSNPLALLGGLYIADTDNPAGGGVDVPELVFTGSIGVGAELNAGIASAGATVNIILTVNFDFYDPDQDTKIRIDELISTFLYEVRTGNPALAPLAIFDISGEISLQLKAYIEFLFARFNFDITPPIVLFEFSIPFEREPFLATERDDGSLLLNIGTNAAARMNGDIRDLPEHICVEYIGGNQAKVWSDSLGVPEGGAQIYEVNPNQGVVAFGGEGDDVIVVKGDIKLTAEGGSGDDIIVLDGSTKSANLRGGVGNDTLVGSGGPDLIWGEEGDDLIHGRGGDDWLFGDFASITNGTVGSLRVSTSDEDGNDIIWGGGEDDVAFGGGGNDILAGDSDAIPGLTFGPFDACGVTIDLDAIASGGTAGDDFLFGDSGRIDSAGGTDTTLILSLDGIVDLADQGRTKFDGIRLTDVDGGGSDNLFGQDGDDVIFAGSGDDQADGGADDDTIYGESGLDTLSGGADDDEVQGGLHKDTIFGFGPGPGDPYNDGGSTDADGEDLLFGDDGNDLIRGNGNSAAGLGDTILGGRGADVLFGDAGDDQIFGENEGDTIFGGADHDYVEGGTGNDTVFGDDGLVIYFAGLVDDPSDDRVIGDALAFGAGSALFDYYDDDSASTLDDDADLTLDLMITYVRAATDGDDTVIGGEGDDIAFGGAGDDTLFGDLDPAQWLAAYAAVEPPPVPAGTDTLIGDGGRIEWFGRRIDLVESFKGVDATEAGDDIISGNGGPDRLLGGGGSDTIFGRMDAIYAENSKLDEDVGVAAGEEIRDNDIGIGDDGIVDFARGTTKLARIATTIYDPLLGETYVDDMFGNWDRDILLGGLAGDNISGDIGLMFSDPRSTDDIILGDNGELIYADNTIPANFGRLELIRTTDIVNTTGGADTIFGNEGDDVILGGVNGSVDVLNGNDGNDVILGDNGELDFALGLDTNLDTLDLIRSYRDGLGGIDEISGDAGHDVLLGGTAGDVMYGDNAGASNAAADGEDVMLGDNGDLFLIGAVGRLTVRVADMPQGTAVDIITTTDSIDLGDPDYDTAAEVEAVGGADTMSGNAQADIMLGGVNNGGVDTMYGDRSLPTPTTLANDGDDIMLGDNGLLNFTFDPDADRQTLDLVGSFEDALGGTDVISGNKGQDVAIGGTGDDTIYGDDLAASAGAFDLGDLLLGDNADILLVDKGLASGGDLKVVLDSAIMTIRTTDEDYDPGVPANNTGGVDTISGNAGDDIIAGGVAGDTLYGDALAVVPNLDGDDIILGDNGAFEWLSTGRLAEIVGIDISANNPDLFAKYNAAIADTELTTLDLITTEQPNNGDRDTIFGDEANDLAFGGTGLDFIHGDDGDESDEGALSANGDVLFGDHGRLYPQFARFQLPNSTVFVQADFHSRNFFAIDIGDADGGEGDLMFGEEGDDVMLGQQGDDRMWGGSQDDDMIGGHNVAGGYDELTAPAIVATLNPPVNDLMDGGSGDDAMAGDNAIVWRRGDDITPRFRQLTQAAMYTTSVDGSAAITANIGALNQSDPDDAVGRDIQLVDHSDAVQATPLGRFGADVMAGGADSDVMYGQLAGDLMQGDGNIALADDGLAQFITRLISVTDAGLPDTTDDYYFNVPEQATDADDYMEGNGGGDLMYGGLGQDDIIGGSSGLFGLTSEQLRPDSADIIFGGAGAPARLVRNDFVGATDTDVGSAVGVGAVPTADDPSIALADRHSRDADFIMGDNANVFRLVNASDGFRQFNYDQSSAFENRGAERIVPRAMQQLDYTLGGADFHGGVYVGGAAQPTGQPADNGAGDLIHGESGDDYIFAMTGSDVVFGESEDDDIVGGYGNEWISGGTGQDGVLGDDGLLLTSRNSTLGEPLYGIAGLLASDATTKYSNGNALDEVIKTPGTIQYAVINVTGELKKTVDLVPFSYDVNWIGLDDEFPDDDTNKPFSDDIIFGGLDGDFLHGASGDDAVSGAEALEHAYVPTFDVNGDPNGVLDLGYNAFDLAPPINPGDTVANPNPGDVLAFNPVDLDGQHLNNRFRAGEFFLYDEYDPLTKILLTDVGTLWKPGDAGVGKEFVLNFDKTEGLFRPAGSVPKPTGQQTETFPAVNDDGRDVIFGDLGNDWLVGGTGRDDAFGGWGNDFLNADDDHTTNNTLNDIPDTHPTYEDRAYGGAGRDVLIANTGGDRLIDWVGEYNTYLVPFAPFGMATVSRTMQPFLPEFLYALSSGDGADPTRYGDAIGGVPPAPTSNDPIPSRNGEPHGELGLVLQKDFAWQDQTGAPADPQAGNIPGGARDVLRSASFSGPQADADGFFVDSGSWSVTSGKYQVEPAVAGGDALSVFLVNKYVPKYFEVLSTLNAVKPVGGFKGNAYIVFDYQSSTDFKFAGINVSTNKLEIGHRTETGWVIDVQGAVQGSLQSDKDYNVFLSVNGSAVTMIVNNQFTLSHTFQPRADADGFLHFANEGMIGLGANQAKAKIDNVVVQRLAPVLAFSQTVDFNNGSTTDLFQPPTSGAWSLANGRYDGAAAGGTPAVNVTSLLVSPSSFIDLSATLRFTGEGGFIFDQYDAENFKFVTISAGKVTIGHRTSRGWFIDATFNNSSIAAGTDYTLGLTLKGSTVSVTLNGQPVFSHMYNALVTDGLFGVFSRNGTTSFDSFTAGHG